MVQPWRTSPRWLTGVWLALILLVSGRTLPAQTNGGSAADTIMAMDRQIRALWEQDQYSQAFELSTQALQLAEAKLGSNRVETAVCLGDLGATDTWLHDYTNAEPALQRSLEILTNAFGSQAPQVARGWQGLGNLYRLWNRPTNAEPLLLRALAIQQQASPVGSRETAITLDNLGLLYSRLGGHQKASQFNQHSLAMLEQTGEPDSPLLATVLNNLAVNYRDLGQYTNAAACFERGLAIREKALGPEHRLTLRNLHNLGNLYRRMGQYTKAAPRCSAPWRPNKKSMVRKAGPWPRVWGNWRPSIRRWKIIQPRTLMINRCRPSGKRRPGAIVRRRPIRIRPAAIPTWTKSKN